jgi:hypothetical protein
MRRAVGGMTISMGILDRLFGRRTTSDPQSYGSSPPWGTASPQQPPPPPSSSGSETPSPAQAARDAEAVRRYRYLLRTAPPEAIEQAHAEAFAQLSPDQRRQVLQQLSQEVPEHERARSDDPASLARMATRAELRQPGVLVQVLGPGGSGPGYGRGYGGGGYGGGGYGYGGGFGGGMGMGGMGMGMGGLIAGSLLASVAGSFIGTAIADEFFDQDQYDASNESIGEVDTGDTGGDTGSDTSSDTGSDTGSDIDFDNSNVDASGVDDQSFADTGGDSGYDGGGSDFGDFGGGDFGGGDFGGGDW